VPPRWQIGVAATIREGLEFRAVSCGVRRRAIEVGLVALVAAAAVGACAEQAQRDARRSPLFAVEVEVSSAVDERARLLETDAASCEPLGKPAARPVDGRSVGAAMQLAAFDDERVALIADEDGRQIRRFALDAATELSPVAVPGAPSALVVAADGRVFATLRDTHRVAVLESGEDAEAPMALRCTRPTPHEPSGLASYPSGLAVTSRWGQSLSLFATDGAMGVVRNVPLPRDPYAVAVTAKGKALVSHAFGGRLSVVDVATGERSERKLGRKERLEDASIDSVERIGTQAFALVPLGDDDFGLPTVMVDPGDTRVVASMAYYGGTAEVPIAVPLVARIDARRQEVFVSAQNPARECLLPKSATYDAGADLMLVGCTGINQVVALKRGAGKERVHDAKVWTAAVTGDPTAMAIDDRNHQLVVWSQFESALTFVSLDTPSDSNTVELVPAGDLDPAYLLGRKLFHEAGKTRLSFDGRACASCHPDGRDDAVTWVTPKGPRQTPMLVGRLKDTAPFGWDGSRGDLHGYIRGTLRRLGGDGLSGADRTALITYLTSLKAPNDRGPLSTPEERGAELFASAVTGCTSCHAGDGLTDRMGHDVGSKARGDDGTEFDTPSLRHLSQSAPYYHDGRYRTLRDLLTDRHSRMGRSAQLPSDDVQALEAYLRRL
jgi:hypothetical protein